jgi:hypothetical protein
VITIARLLYIRERRHCELERVGAFYFLCSGTTIDFFSPEVANEVFSDEIAGMQDD